jgi:hypothetical protein
LRNWLLGIVFCFLVTGLVVAQEIPVGVNYKRASDTVNATAKAALERALKNGDQYPAYLLPDVVTCGPMLWKALKPSADKVLLESKVTDGFVATPEPTHVELRGLLTERQRRSFWAELLDKYPKLKTATVRKATAGEISYYWATIPFDIQEPFFAIDDGSEVFVAHFGEQSPALFWIDLVGKLGDLRN